MRFLNRILLGGMALLLATPLLWADCCSAPLISAKSEKDLAEMYARLDDILKRMGGKEGGMSGGGMLAPPKGGGGTEDIVTPTGDGTVTPGVGSETLIKNLEDGVVASAGFTREPRQQAVVAWNGKQEIMVLQTLQESLIGKGTFLQFLPLPGKPIDVRAGDKDLFNNISTLILTKSKVPEAEQVVARVVFEKAIGPHHIFVWKVDSYEHFLSGVQGHIRKIYKGKAMPLITRKMEKVLRSYFDRGFRYFAFDLVQITPTSTKIEALEYHFESNHLFYPVGITMGGASGHTRIDLAVITAPTGLNRFFGSLQYKEEIAPWGKTVKLNAGELQAMGKAGARIAQLFDNGGMAGRMWILRGDIDRLQGDVQADLRKGK